MDGFSSSKTQLWLNIVGAVVCYVMFCIELYTSITQHSSYISSLVFIFLTVSCTIRIYTWLTAQKKEQRPV